VAHLLKQDSSTRKHRDRASRVDDAGRCVERRLQSVASDRAIRLGDQFIDQRRRPLAALKVRLDGGERDFR
jgi:hypothetical protein